MPSLILSHLLLVWLALQRLALCGERASTRERFKVVIAPLICKRTCLKGQCQDTCEQGNNTTLIGENGQSADTLTGPGFRVVVCPLTCMNGGVCSTRTHCLCPPGFTGRLCQFPLRTQASRGNKQPFYTLQVSISFTPCVNVRVVHTPDTSVVIHPHDQSENKPHSAKTVTRLPPQTHKPKGRCFQETTPKQACSSNPLPGLTNQEDCCGSVGNSWGQNKCYKCPSLPYAGKHQTIVEDFGSTCPQGYKRLNSTHCQDINECMMQGLCQNGECLNTQGSFRCTCKPGYVLAERTRCVATVEQGLCYRMVTEAGKCEHALPKRLSQEICCCTVGKAWGSNCERCPLDGTASFNKICPAGKGMSFLTYHGTLIGLCKVLLWLFNEKSVIKCYKMFFFHNYDYVWGLGITAMDDCKLNRNICGHGECVNTQNGYVCHCYPGYQPHAQGKSCVDENECDLEPCGRGTCFNTVGSYRCNCHPGYKLVVHHGKRRCIDINECSKPDICGVGGHCTNLPGSYKCECLPGFRSKSRRQPLCEDIYECSDPSVCPNEQCENTVGSYECIPCQPGYQAQGGVCYDINECQDNRLCANGHCVNTEGSFRCQCYPGYQPTQEGSHCEDINECERASNCQRGRCINTMGSYRCECQKGYALFSGRRCQDRVDMCACATMVSDCLKINTAVKVRVGLVNKYVCSHEFVLPFFFFEVHFICFCFFYTEIEIVGDKKECYLNLDDTVFCDSVLATNVTKQECCCSIGVGWGDHCEIYPCPVYHSVEYLSLCPVGRGFYHDEGPIEYGLPMRRDIDECVLFSNEICKEGRCMNTQPGFECYCQQGFYYDSNLLECIGVDECQDPANCKNGHCVNTQDSYYCICTPPWILATDRNSCVTPEEQAGEYTHKDICFEEVDEDHMCTMPQNDLTVTYSECCCHYGRGWGPECRTCPNRNSGKRHLFEIQSLYRYFWSILCTLRDSSEEDSDECSCANGRCVRSYLGTMCDCNTGFILDHSRTRCIDIDECAGRGTGQSPCKNARCINTFGSFKCHCKVGFVAARRPNVCIRARAQ
uniref:Latent transforming growth factor beta binding protein 3 n=1 Tax=Cyprinus carpio TaxID=7962 RepID=A0A8C1NUF5_CYPCA